MTTVQPHAPRILVADDDADMGYLVMESLRKDGYEVVNVTDGGQLLLRITDFYRLRPAPDPIDLIVTDVRMPGCSGFDIVEALRDADWHTPVVIMTAFGDQETRQRARALHSEFLEKPFKMMALRTLVRDLLAYEKAHV